VLLIFAHMKFYSLLFAIGCSFLLPACSNNNNGSNNSISATEAAPPTINYTVLNTHPHDTSFFTEGLEFNDGKLFEASGGSKEETPHPSAFGILNLQTGKVDKKVELNNTVYFGEGITFFKGRVYQLTWQNHKGFVYDAHTFKKIKEFDYAGEGWSLTHDSSHLIMSDGSSILRFLDPETLKTVTQINVTDNTGPVSNINELEYIDGFIYANVWQTDHLIKIDPATGKVVGKLNLDSLVKQIRTQDPNADFLNGIAYNPDSKTIYVTGKLWPLVFEIKVD
jgi:glutamine cyclotransferase